MGLYTPSSGSDEDGYRTERLKRVAPQMTPDGFVEAFLRALIYAARITQGRPIPDGRTSDDLVHDVMLRACEHAPLTCATVDEMLQFLRPRIHREAWRSWRKAERRPPLIGLDSGT